MCFCDNQMRNNQNRFFRFCHNWSRYEKIKKKLKIETVLNVVVEQIRVSRIKFCRLRKQIFFEKSWKKNCLIKICLLSKNSNVWKNLKKSMKFNKLLKSRRLLMIFSFLKCFFFYFLFWFDQFVVDKILERIFDSFWNVLWIFMCFSK